MQNVSTITMSTDNIPDSTVAVLQLKSGLRKHQASQAQSCHDTLDQSFSHSPTAKIALSPTML